MNNVRDEIEKAEETISHLNEEISELEEKKAGIEAEVKRYDDDMLKITTFKPIDALLTLYKALTDIVDYMDAHMSLLCYKALHVFIAQRAFSAFVAEIISFSHF